MALRYEGISVHRLVPGLLTIPNEGGLLVYAQRASLIAFFVVAVWSRATPAGELELKLGQVRESSLSPGQAQSFMVSLGEGDFAQIGVNPRGHGTRCQNLRSVGQALSRRRTGAGGGQTQLRRRSSGCLSGGGCREGQARKWDIHHCAREGGDAGRTARSHPSPWWKAGGFKLCGLRSNEEKRTASTRFGRRSGRQARR